MAKGVLVDISKCIGCKACQVACKQWHDLPATTPQFSNDLSYPPKMDAYNYTQVMHRYAPKGDDIIMRYAKKQCLHCLEPACASACFSKALQRDEVTGAVVYRSHLCVGCRYCMLACPFDVPTYEWDQAFPLVSKCKFCFDPQGKYDRMRAGLTPACVTVCPSGCLKYGDRDELLQEAWQRINSNPKYIEHVYGEREAGGTAWMYISDVPFETFDFRMDVPNRPLPEYSHDFLKYTPHVVVTWGGLLTLLYHYTKRRKQVNQEDKENIQA